MRLRTFVTMLVGLWGLVGFSGVRATPTAQAEEAFSKMRLGLALVPMPFGTLKGGTRLLSGVEVSSDSEVAFGVLPYFDYSLTRYFFLGVAPQYTFNVKAQNISGDAARQFDLLLRLGGNAPVADTIQLYGYIAPGYSVVMLPNVDDATGLALGFHGGAMFDLTAAIYLNAELGYQFGYQTFSLGGQTIDFKTNYFQLGLGAGVRL